MKSLLSPKTAAKLRLYMYCVIWLVMMTLISLLVASPNPLASIAGGLTGGAVVLAGVWLTNRRALTERTTAPHVLSDTVPGGTSLSQDEERILARTERSLTHNQVTGWLFQRALGNRRLGDWSGSWRTQDAYWWRELASAVGYILIVAWMCALIADIIALIALSNGHPA